MSVVINSNQSASIAANNLAYSNAMLQNSLNKLSSGSKIVNPSDDAGGLAVSMKLSATAHRQSELQNNLGDATSYAQTQDGALQVTGSVLDRISELATLYKDPTKNASDLANYNDEFTQLQGELNAIGSQTFNGIALFGTGTLTVATTDDLSASNAVSVAQQQLLTSGGGTSTFLSDFSSASENALDSGKWTDASTLGGSSAVSGGILTLDGTSGSAEIQSVATPASGFDLSLDVNVGTGATFSFGDYLVEGNNATPGQNGLVANNWTTVGMHVAANGAVTVSGAADVDLGGTWTAGDTLYLQSFNGSSQVRNLTITAPSAGGTSNVGTVASAASLGSLSLSTITSAIQDVASMRATNGAEQSRINFASTLLTTNQTNLQSAISNISDVDVAQETTNLAKWNVLVQAGTSMLTQANQSAQIALKLITGAA
jgi:flagellin